MNLEQFLLIQMSLALAVDALAGKFTSLGSRWTTVSSALILADLLAVGVFLPRVLHFLDVMITKKDTCKKS
jgi:hypothetical protein